MAFLASLILMVPMVAIIWGLAFLLEIYHVPTYVGVVVMMVIGTAFPAWLMSSTRLTRWIVAIMTWAERS